MAGRNLSVDYLGLIMPGLVLIIFFGTIGIASFLIIFKLDPNYVPIGDMFPYSADSWLTIILRFCIILFAGLEAARTITLFILFTVSVPYTYCCVLRIIERIPMRYNPISKYIELQIINQIGMDPLRQVAAVLMGTGFLLAVLGAWTFCLGWKFFPLLVYAFFGLITVNTYTVIGLALPKVIKCHELSEKTMQIVWPILLREHCMRYFGGLRGFAYKVKMRRLSALQPISVYYGGARFDKDTKTTFYTNILEETINIILITKDMMM